MSSQLVTSPAARNSASDYAVVGAGFLAATGLIALGLWLSYASADGSTIAVTTATGALLLSTIGVRMSQTNRSLLDPLTLFCLLIFVYFVMHLFWVLSQPTTSLEGLQRPFRDALTHSQTIIALGCVALVIGFMLGNRVGCPKVVLSRRDLSLVPNPVLLGTFLVGMAFQYLAHRVGGQYDSKNVLVYETLGYSAFTAYVVAVLKLQSPNGTTERRRLRVLVYGVMLPVQAFWALSHGSKVDLVVVVVAYLAVREVRGRSVRLRWIALSGVLFLAVLTPVVDQARSTRGTSQALISRPLISDAIQTVTHIGLRNLRSLSHGYDLIQNRTGGSESLALAVKYTPSLRGYQWGRSLAVVPLELVPHVIWPGKPYYSVGRDFSVIYAGQLASQGAGLTVSPTIPGDLYMNFGPAGVLGGFLIIGVLLRWISRMVEGGHPSDFTVLIYIGLLIQCLFLEQDLGVVISGAVTHVGAAILFAWVLRAMSRHERREVTT